jgi:hypothetical protein
MTGILLQVNSVSFHLAQKYRRRPGDLGVECNDLEGLLHENLVIPKDIYCRDRLFLL